MTDTNTKISARKPLLVAIGFVLIQATTLFSQDLPPLHTTLASWDDAVWLDFLDRNNSIGGRNSDLGALKRWNDQIDRKYLLDLYVLGPNQGENYKWTRQKNGFRWMSGSISRRDLATFASFKSEVGIGDTWDLGVRLDMVRVPRARRAAFRLHTAKRISKSFRVAAKLHLDPEKPGSDFGLALRWSQERRDLSLEVWVLDVFNDLIHVAFDAASQPQIQYTEDYLTQAFAIRGTADFEIIKDLRFEGYGAYLPTSQLHVTDRADPTFGYKNTEDIWYGAALLEWRPTERLLFSAFGTNTHALSGKIWDHPTNPGLDYQLTERTTRIGASTVYRPKERLEISLQAERNWRPEVRIEPSSTDTLVAYTLESWLGTAGGRLQTRGSFFVDLWLAYQKSDEPLGSGQVPSAGTLAADQARIAVDLGWWFGEAVWFSLGMGQDIGTDAAGNGFGGARGKGVLTW